VATVGSYGLLVELDHGDGLLTRYAHCSRVLVKVGDQVDRGDRIATVGRSGLTTGPHLHYEIIYKGQPVDPLLFIG
jgi:murein DD-endopeptidase MepM/ murein hydrolase activator NlpD